MEMQNTASLSNEPKRERFDSQDSISSMHSHYSTSSRKGGRSRVASEELIVPTVQNVNSVYYGVDAFSPTLVDFYTVDQKRIVWSSRAHRKMMMTLYRAWHNKHWKLYSLSFWGSALATLSMCLFLVGLIGEVLTHINFGADATGSDVHLIVDFPLFIASLCYFAFHVVNYLEVINSCHNLEIWLDEYFHGREPLLERQYLGFFYTRIDFWTELLGMLGALLYVFSRLFVLYRSDDGINYGVIDVDRTALDMVLGYWLPFFIGSFLLLLSGYLAHVEVVHQWFSWRLSTLESRVTGLNLLSTLGFFIASTTQFIDPFGALFTFADSIVPFIIGCIFGLASSLLSLVELETIHQRNKHPEYGLLKETPGYGSV